MEIDGDDDDVVGLLKEMINCDVGLFSFLEKELIFEDVFMMVIKGLVI